MWHIRHPWHTFLLIYNTKQNKMSTKSDVRSRFAQIKCTSNYITFGVSFFFVLPFAQSSFLLPSWTHTLGQSAHTDVDAACIVQEMILRVRTVACCEVAMGIRMSLAWKGTQWTSHAIMCLQRKDMGICCGLHRILDTLNEGDMGYCSLDWISTGDTEQWGAMSKTTLDPMHPIRFC